MVETAQTAPVRWAREYELIYILRPDAGEEAADKVSSRVVDAINTMGGTLIQVRVWGKRRLAYRVRKQTKGVFIYLRFLGYSGLVQEIERNLRMLDTVIKYMTVMVRDHVDPATVAVDPEEVKFHKIDFSEEPEEEPVDFGGGAPGRMGEREGADEFLDYELEPIPISGDRRRRRRGADGEEVESDLDETAEGAGSETEEE